MDKSEARNLLAHMMAAIKKIGHILFVVTADDAAGYEDVVVKFVNRIEIPEEADRVRIFASTAYRSSDFVLSRGALRLAG